MNGSAPEYFVGRVREMANHAHRDESKRCHDGPAGLTGQLEHENSPWCSQKRSSIPGGKARLLST